MKQFISKRMAIATVSVSMVLIAFSYLSTKETLPMDSHSHTQQKARPIDYGFTTIEGQAVRLSDYRGKAVLIVNTASRCGFTKQYAGLQSLWEKYRAKGLVVIAVPSNDFAGQEPLNGEEIKSFCQVNYGITFPIMDKVHVTGKEAHPFYAEVRERFGFTGAPKWNFHKYLISPQGELVDWFSSFTAPESDKLEAAIEQVLPNPHLLAQTTAIQ
jgi:glutathione peroxidase